MVNPARAGMIPVGPRPTTTSLGKPRTRGDDPAWTREAEEVDPVNPARAGMIPTEEAAVDPA